jgi:PKD domain-containing protein
MHNSREEAIGLIRQANSAVRSEEAAPSPSHAIPSSQGAPSTPNGLSCSLEKAPVAVLVVSPGWETLPSGSRRTRQPPGAPARRPLRHTGFDFGDGTTAKAGTAMQHRFTVPGPYGLIVNVEDSVGLRSTARGVVSVLPPSPTPGASSTPDAPPCGGASCDPAARKTLLAITADASGSSDWDATPVASYRFDFGDGTAVSAGHGPSGTTRYVAPGTYKLTVVVTDSAGLACSSVSSVA